MRLPLPPTRDLAWRLWRRGYDALPLAGGPARPYEARLLGRRTVVVRGAEGVKLFYDPDVVARDGAVPPPLAGLLFGRGAVHGLDGEAHRERKAMFTRILDRAWAEDLATAVGRELEGVVAGWSGREVIVFDELVEVYGRTVLRHAGVELAPDEADRVAHDLAAVVDGFGFAGAAYVRAWRQRVRLDRWAARLVRDVRDGRVSPPPGSVLSRIALAEGADLSPRVAGVELLNVLRPTVAVAWLGTFAARALVQRPSWAPWLRPPTAQRERVAFTHEVRRLAPFVPALTGLVRRPARADGMTLRPGDRVLLDVPGTNTDPSAWPDPRVFRPERFVGGDPDPWSYVPQGGGDLSGHRCPGEPTTVAVLAETVRVLAAVEARPVGELHVDRSRIPALPADGLVLRVA